MVRRTFLLALALAVAGSTTAWAGETHLEQVRVRLPQVTVYGTGLETEGLEVNLGQRKLSLKEASSFAQTNEPASYYVLLDISNSMPEGYFDAVKESVVRFEESLDENDRLSVYTFGEQVNLILDENHERAQTQAALAAVDNIDNRTRLFDAISEAAAAAERSGAASGRCIFMVISDGEDVTIGGAQTAEAQASLEQKGIPVYAFGIADTSREHLNQFGEFARNSGGSLTVFGEAEAGSFLTGFHQQMEAAQVLKLLYTDNVVSNQMETLTVKTAANQTVTKNVMVSEHIPDQTAPAIVTAELTEDGQLLVEFSEPVAGLGEAASYTVTPVGEKKKAEAVAVSSVTFSQDKENTVLLTFSAPLPAGSYQLGCVNVCDLSMEKNSVENTMEFQVAPLPLPKQIAKLALEWAWVAGVAVVLIAVFCLFRKVKKGRGVVYVDGKPVMASQIEVHKHVKIKNREGKSFTLEIRTKGNKPEEMSFTMNGSFIIGRSQICNLYLDDKKMSRQHIALEWENGEMYVSDLNTTNGTMLNGTRITDRQRLSKGDTIAAGSVEMTIRW